MEIRLLRSDDDLESLTALLHRAYAPLAAMGFRYVATHQDAETTRRRASRGECYVALAEGRTIGTLVVVPPEQRAPHCEWYDRPDVSVVSQFAIEPAHQARGLGSQLLRFAEGRAAALGAAEVSVDTAEHAGHLVAFYEARGYRPVGYVQWQQTNYRSVLLSKALRERFPLTRF